MIAKRSKDVQIYDQDEHKLRQHFGKVEEICQNEGGEAQPHFASPIVSTNTRMEIARACQFSDEDVKLSEQR